MQYKVPQNVEREDQILWFITLRQLIILLIGGGISYLLFIHFVRGNNSASTLVAILCWVPALLSVAFAFLKIKGIGLFQLFLLVMEHGFFRYPRRYWIAGAGDPFLSVTTKISSLKKEKQIISEKKLDKKKLKNAADFLDNKTYYSDKQKQNA